MLADLGALATLPARELRAGYAEVLKYGVLGDPAFFDWLARNCDAVLALEPGAIEHAVVTSVAAKVRIVAEDERETTGVRACSILATRSDMPWRRRRAFQRGCCTAKAWRWAWSWPRDTPHAAT